MPDSRPSAALTPEEAAERDAMLREPVAGWRQHMDQAERHLNRIERLLGLRKIRKSKVTLEDCRAIVDQRRKR